jgi:hypothetical protein
MDKPNFYDELPRKLGLQHYTSSSNFGLQQIKYKQDSIGADRIITFNVAGSDVEVLTESCEVSGNASSIQQLYQLISRLNDLINFGTLEIVPETYAIRFKCGQILHPCLDPLELIQKFIEYHNMVFPNMIECVKEVIFHSKPIIEAVGLFSNPYETKSSSSR